METISGIIKQACGARVRLTEEFCRVHLASLSEEEQRQAIANPAWIGENIQLVEEHQGTRIVWYFERK